MSHTIKSKSRLVGRVRRIKGQIEAVERALESELGCADVLMLVASVDTCLRSPVLPIASRDIVLQRCQIFDRASQL
ncbi:metal-sensing transcriptional repressor [Bradyrhizobium sp.]|uniref:metal-sensing transcriptional repressor n=1 Tax=Bradyrhizobium sp. TaxID=376 RepID=UPI0025C44DFA|nr:metal-sensing transcriptional repressor [Bradyrhizobium sp.]